MKMNFLKYGSLLALMLICGCGDNWVVMKQGEALCRVNKKTGEAYVMRGNAWVPVKEYTPPVEKPKKAQRKATSSELRNITGRGSFSGKYFFADIYNGNEHCVVKRLAVGLKIIDQGGNILDGPRKYISSADVKPFDTKSVSFSVLRAPLTKREWDRNKLEYVNRESERYEWFIENDEVLVEDVD